MARSDDYEVRAACTSCGDEEEALRVASHPAPRDDWRGACWEVYGIRIRNRYSPGGQATSVALTSIGGYKTHTLLSGTSVK
jgi:hypothetical protein